MSKRNLATIDSDMFTPIGRLLQQSMAHGITNDMIYGGLETGQTSLQGIHAEAITQNCRIGTRRVSWDGRVYRYGCCSNIISVRHFGIKFWYQIGDGLAANTAADSAVGDTTITMTDASATLNEYAYGYVTMFSTPYQSRGIISNTAVSGGTTTITLDNALTTALSSTYTEVLHNPYGALRLTAGPSGGDSGNDYSSVAGIPCTITTVAGYYLWIQTWGPIWINPHGSSLQDVGITGSERKVVFDCEGSITLEDDAAHGPCAGGEDMQHAGFIIDRSASSTSGPPLIMLQISP